MTTVIGLDLSLASTGVAGVVPGGAWTDTIHSKPDDDVSTLCRLRQIRGALMDHIHNADLVVVEGLAISRQTGQHLTRAGLWHMVMEKVDGAGIPWAEVTPGAVKKYATGNGGASKDAVLLAVERRWGKQVRVDNNNEADALTLAAMGAHHLQVSTLPTVPKTHATALDKVRWPEQIGVPA